MDGYHIYFAHISLVWPGSLTSVASVCLLCVYCRLDWRSRSSSWCTGDYFGASRICARPRPPHAYSRQIIRYIFATDHFVTSGLTIFRLPQLAIRLDMNSRQIIHIWHCYICRDFLRQFGFHLYCLFIVVDIIWTAFNSKYCHSQSVIFADCKMATDWCRVIP